MHPHSVTQALKLASPFWYRVRQSLTLPVAIGLLVTALGFFVASLVEFKSIRTDVTALTVKVSASQARDLEAAAQHQQVVDIDTRLTKMENIDARLKTMEDWLDRGNKIANEPRAVKRH